MIKNVNYSLLGFVGNRNKDVHIPEYSGADNSRKGAPETITIGLRQEGARTNVNS
jgi:hypothetical protein